MSSNFDPYWAIEREFDRDPNRISKAALEASVKGNQEELKTLAKKRSGVDSDSSCKVASIAIGALLFLGVGLTTYLAIKSPSYKALGIIYGVLGGGAGAGLILYGACNIKEDNAKLKELKSQEDYYRKKLSEDETVLRSGKKGTNPIVGTFYYINQ